GGFVGRTDRRHEARPTGACDRVRCRETCLSSRCAPRHDSRGGCICDPRNASVRLMRRMGYEKCFYVCVRNRRIDRKEISNATSAETITAKPQGSADRALRHRLQPESYPIGVRRPDQTTRTKPRPGKNRNCYTQPPCAIFPRFTKRMTDVRAGDGTTMFVV